MNQRDLFRKKIEEKKEKSSKKPRYGMRKLSVGFVSCLVGFVMFLTGVPVMAEGGQSRSVNNEVHYTLAGETAGVLDYARTDYTKEDSDGIHLTVTKWAKLARSWGHTDDGPYNGRYLLNFFDDDFYTQIESIKVNNVQFEKEADGALWKVPIDNATMQSGLIGVVTNNDIVIKLKNGATLTSLGLADKKINFTTTWVRGDGKADTGGYDNGFILKNNDNVPTLPTNEWEGNEYYLGKGIKLIEHDGTKSKDGNFTSGKAGKSVSYNAREKAIRSTVSFKPDVQFETSNSGWVLYINEVIPKELLKYIDTDNVRLGVSTVRGEITASSPIKLTVAPNGNGLISTKDTPSLSIVNGDWSKVEQVRDTLAKQVFKGVTGQSRSYTIEYKLKSNVSNQEFAKALNEYITTNNDQLNFESWLTADFVDSTNMFLNIRKPDGGKPNKILQNSYSNAFMEVLDTDKDGLYDFTEDEIESDKFNVDTDGDGVPDGQEVLTDKTNPKDAKSYLVVKPDVTTKNIEANSAQTIVGKVPKTIYDNPADTNKKLAATNTDAGEVIVKAYKYVADDTDYTTQPVKAQTTIPFAGLTDGNFTVNVPAGTFAEGDKVILVAYSPDGNNPKVSSTTVRVGAIKVTFDTNGGKWSDGTNADKVVNAVNGTATQPEEPTRDGYQFLGWASTANATAAEAGILNNIEDAKEVFAVWKDNKAPVIGNINDQTVVERNAITEINVTTDDPTATVTVKDLPSGLTYSNGKISGTPSVTSWGNDEKKEFTVTVEAKDPSGNTSTKTFKIIVQRDTDSDGTPDITDTDDDGDGVPDTEEIAKGSDPKNPDSRPMGTVTPVSPTTISNPTQTLIDENAITNIVITPGNTASTVTVDTSKLPNGVTYDPTTKTISGTPDVTNWGTDETKKFDIPVVITNPDGSKVTKTVEITVQRDTDGDGIPDITDTDDDGDGYTDLEESAKGTDPKDPTSKPTTGISPIADQTVVERNPINEITVTTDDPSATITVKDLPTGVTYDPSTKKISGTPSVTSWTGNDETKDFTVTIEAKDSANNVVTRTFKITVQRDTDSDGTPDVTDTDDDGDGVTDTEEIAKGSDPKNPNSRPMGTVTPVSPTTISNPTQTLIDENAITNIVITPGNTASTVTVDTSKLPNGVTYDPTTKTISGTPDVTNWTGMEEFKKFEVPVVVTNPDGSKVTKTIEIRVERDTDGDGTPDVTDTDDDGDGVTDTEEIAKGSDPKNPNSRPMGTVTPVSPTTISNPTQTLIDENAITNIVITPGNTASTVTVDTSKLPNGVTYDPTTKTISGTPDVTNWGTDETKKFDIPVVITNPDGSKVTKTVEITVQRDTDGDGIPDITDTDDDGDGYTDLEESAKGTDPKDPTSKPTTGISPIADQTVVERNPINEITVTTDDPSATITVKDLPTGVTYDPSTKKISGTPSVTSWTGNDETKDFTVTIEAKDSANNVVTRTFKITVQRDTDSDGTPDVTDTDDDGDGVTDTEEIAKGSDPKNPNSRPMGTVTPVSPTTISNPTQTLIDENAITNIVITPGNTASTVTVDTSKLPNGVTYDPTTKTISGTPDVTNWGTDETKKFDIPVVITNPDGSKVTKTVEITVQRDTDGDGIPDITDTDDDGDGYTDLEESAKGTDPKDPTSKPTTGISPIADQTVVERNPINEITVTTDDPSATITVKDLPTGVTYDPSTKKISGTPSVTSWTGNDETKDFTVTIEAKDSANNVVTRTFKITVQRDTDSDGTPDVTDTDDDGDGVTDTEEIAKGSDPKNPNSRPMGTVTPVSPTTISNPTQTLIDENAITNIVITPGNTASTVTVDTSKLPNGVTYDPTTKTISGTPDVTNWGTDETKKFDIPVVITNPDGSKVTKTVEISVQRDTDSDGTPDVTDTDDDGDGVTDTEEIAKGSDPKNPNSRPMGTVTPVSPTTISNPTQTLIDENAITNIVITPGNTASTVTVDTSKLPNGVTYDPTTKTISGTPDVTNWGTDETKKFDIPVVITNPDGSKVTKTVEITVQRDTDGDGIPDITDTDDDGDGYTDLEESAKGTDPKDPTSKPTTGISPIADQTVVERNPINEITVTTDDPSATITVKDLPTGVTYDPSTKKISGTPSVTSWTGNDETKDFTVTIEAKDSANNVVTRTFKITVQRDTDSDGTPDVTDTDDDGDGVTDTEEIAKGSDPKNPNSRPMGTVTPVSPTTISNPTQTLIDENAITNIVITPGNTASTVTVDTSKLPNGVTYDPTTKTISGTPDVTNWGPSEETRKFEVPVVVTNPDGSKTTKTIEIVVQRDTDKDGNPDVTDPDDDNDGVTDVEENAKGTNPKDPNSKPTNTSTQTNNQGSGKKIDTGRIAGKDRIDTAIDISKKLYKKSKAVIIVRSDIFPDSMTASVLARLKDAPILLNPTGQLDSRVAAEIKRLGATEIIIVGGTDSISARVRDELRAYDSDNDVERIGGKDRYETSELVARKVISITGNKNTAVVASGQVFPDALTVGTFASRDGYPILLVKKDIVPSQIERVIKDLDIDKVYIAGGTDTISKRVEAKLPRVIERMAGRDRYETSVAIARSKFKDSKEAFVASGQQFADALVISPVSGKYNLPTLLVSTNASSNQEVKRYIQQSKINKLIAVGGERYLPSSIIDSLIK